MAQTILYRNKLPVVLVALASVSSPFSARKEVREALEQALAGRAFLIDISEMRLDHVYDLLGLFDRAACLVTVDTMHLHLARASAVPVVSILNDGWRGSVPHGDFPFFKYSSTDPVSVAACVKLLIGPKEELTAFKKTLVPHRSPKFYHVTDVFGSDARHHVARATWQAQYNAGMVPVHVSGYPRDAKTELGDPRALPYLKDLMKAGIDASENDSDVIVWTNSDIGLKPGIMQALDMSSGATSMRRTESNGEHHMGRDLFAFTVDWLRTNWDELPDYIIGVPVFDLGLVAMIRHYALFGLPALVHREVFDPLTTKNVGIDMPPADTPPGYALHQSHSSEWLVKNHHLLPATRHNKRLFVEWAEKHKPDTVFSPGGNLK